MVTGFQISPLKFMLLLLFSVLFTFPAIVDAQNMDIDYSFFVAGHTYGNPGGGNIGLHRPFKQKFAYIKSRPEIKFGVLTGDIARPNPTEASWNNVDADLDSLGLPVYFAVGNHDMENRALFEERYGDTYYSFIYENDLFVVLDPNPDGWNISGDQLEFLKNALSENKDKINHLFVFFHQILWWKENSVYTDYRPNSFAGKADSTNYWSELEPLFTGYPKPVFLFAGDFGAAYWSADFMYDRYGNISMIGSGMGEETGDNFVIVNVLKNHNIDYDLICLNDEDLECFGELTDYRLTTHTNIFKNEKGVKVYPNPASTEINIEIKNFENSAYTFSVYNSAGIQLMQKNVSKSHHTIHLNLDNGMYFYHLKNQSEIFDSGKLVIIR